MKRGISIVGYGLNFIAKSFGNMFSWIICLFTEVKPRRVMCWAYNFKQYGCNPRYLTEYVLQNYPDMELWWVFRRGVDTTAVDPRVKIVRFRSWQYYKLLATAEFLVTNARTNPHRIYWHKRKDQKYLMLWHAGVALKRVERDAEAQLSFSYIRRAKNDSKVCDLMISGSRMHTELIYSSFWYDGEVLECGIPRNDIFFNKEQHTVFRERVTKMYGIDAESRIVLYAPTFRRDGSIEPYRINWAKVIPTLQKKFGGDRVSVIVRLHPNLMGKVDTSSLVAYDGVVDGTMYHDMQELLCVADMLITDYSSSMFDFSLQGKPCLLYAPDMALYDRGYYFNLKELPYPYSENEMELISNIENFDAVTYAHDLDEFLAQRVGVKERGDAAKSLAQWMAHKSLKQ